MTTTTAAETSKNNNSKVYLSKFKSKNSSASVVVDSVTLQPATLSPATNVSNISNVDSNNTQKHHKFQAASFALRRQFQTRRLTTTSSSINSDESSATDVPSTQNPLFKRRLTLISTAAPPRSRTTALFSDTTTAYFGIEDDGDQVAKSSIHTSHFNQIPDEVRPQISYGSPISSTTTTQSTPPHFNVNSTRRQLIPRPRRPQSGTNLHREATTASVSTGSSPPASRRQQSRRRPHKYIEVYSRPPSKPALATATSTSTSTSSLTASRRTSPAAYDYQNDQQMIKSPNTQWRRSGIQSQSPVKSKSKLKSEDQLKVILHGQGIIECLDQGNFPHPLSCRKFISCAQFEETGGIVGWEYTCPKGLEYDGLSGMCSRTSHAKSCRD